MLHVYGSLWRWKHWSVRQIKPAQLAFGRFKIVYLLTYLVNRNPYIIDRMLRLSMTFSDLWPGFQGHNIYEVEYGKKWSVLKTKLLLHKTKLYLTYGIAYMFGDLDWPVNASRGFVSISWASFYYKCDIWHYCCQRQIATNGKQII